MRVGEQRACLMCWEQVHQPGSSLLPGKTVVGSTVPALDVATQSAAHPWARDTCSMHWKGGLASAPPLCQGHLPPPTPPSPHTLPAHTDQHSLHTWVITSLGSALQRVGSNHVASRNCSFFASLCEGQMSDT